MIDNYDSFTYNLVHLFEELGAEVVTVRNDAITVDEARAGGFDRLVVSPGPGRPESAGVSIELIQALGPTVPTLGVCLGHQAIVEAFGGTVGQAKALLHGKASTITHDGRGVYAGLPAEVEVGRYHSLAAIEVPAELDGHVAHRDGEVMGVRHRDAADRGRPVPPGERADAARPGDGEELPTDDRRPRDPAAPRRPPPLPRGRARADGLDHGRRGDARPRSPASSSRCGRRARRPTRSPASPRRCASTSSP